MTELTGLLRELSVWAAARYPLDTVEPSNNEPPPELPPGPVPEAALLALFTNTTSAEHHLALVDLPPIREALERLPRDSPALAAVRTSWRRHLAAARAGSEASHNQGG